MNHTRATIVVNDPDLVKDILKSWSHEGDRVSAMPNHVLSADYLYDAGGIALTMDVYLTDKQVLKALRPRKS